MFSEEDRWTFFYKTTNAHKHVASALEKNKPAVNLRMDSRWMFLPSAFWGFFLFFSFFLVYASTILGKKKKRNDNEMNFKKC